MNTVSNHESQDAISPAVLAAVAEQTARSAGDFIRRSLEDTIVVNERHAHDMKIQMDVDSQKLITRLILERFPLHAILGEEGGEGSGGKGYEWIIDPIDGTVNFAYGIPHFCVSITCRHDGVLLAGAIMDPNRDECFVAWYQGGAWLNHRPIHVSDRADLGRAIISVGFSRHRPSLEKCVSLYQYYAPRACKVRIMGVAALDMAYVAAGRMDAYIEQDIKLWDIAAGHLLIEEAGGKVELTPRELLHHYTICASNGFVDLPMK